MSFDREEFEIIIRQLGKLCSTGLQVIKIISFFQSELFGAL
jgi:hypothetical protein